MATYGFPRSVPKSATHGHGKPTAMHTNLHSGLAPKVRQSPVGAGQIDRSGDAKGADRVAATHGLTDIARNSTLGKPGQMGPAPVSGSMQHKHDDGTNVTGFSRTEAHAILSGDKLPTDHPNRVKVQPQPETSYGHRNRRFDAEGASKPGANHAGRVGVHPLAAAAVLGSAVLSGSTRLPSSKRR